MPSLEMKPHMTLVSKYTLRQYKSPTTPWFLGKHSNLPHTNSECYQQYEVPTSIFKTKSGNVSNKEKIRPYNHVAVSGVISFNATVENTHTPVTQPLSNPTAPEGICKFETSFNVMKLNLHCEESDTPSSDTYLIITRPFPVPLSSSCTKPTYTDTASNWAMYRYFLLLNNLCTISPVLIKVSDRDTLSRIVVTHMVAEKIDRIAPDGK